MAAKCSNSLDTNFAVTPKGKNLWPINFNNSINLCKTLRKPKWKFEPSLERSWCKIGHTPYEIFLSPLNWGLSFNGNKLKWIIGTHGNWKNHIPGGRFGSDSWTELPIQPIWPIFAVNRLKWQCCLACSSKMAPRILIFSITMGADYSFGPNSIKTYFPQFIGHNEIFLGSVWGKCFVHI